MTQTKITTGEIFNVEDHGSIVLVFFLADDQRVILIPFDHRPFCWMLEGEGCEASELIGRKVQYDGETLFFQKEDNE